MTRDASLLSQLESLVTGARAGDALVPVDDEATFAAIAGEMIQIADEFGDEPIRIVADPLTADTFRQPPPSALARCPIHVVVPGATSSEDRFLVLWSNKINVALVGRGDAASGSVRGGWTGVRRFVASVCAFLGESPEGRRGPRRNAAAESPADWVNFRLMNRLSRHYIERKRDMAQDKDTLTTVLEILKSLSAKRQPHDILYMFVDQIASVVGIDRCSVVRVGDSEREGHVLASHEDQSITDIAIDLDKYPEIRHSLETRRMVLINDVGRDELMRPHVDGLRQSGITAILVIPIVLFDQNIGSFVLRAVRKGRPFDGREVNFCEIVSEAAANALERAHLFDNIQKANQRLERLAVTDGLTGLHNRRYFRDRLDEEYERSMRYHVPLTCVMIDIDNFKRINDTYGHLQGDSILREVSARTLKSVRASDTVARYGGEEIVILLPQADMAGVRLNAQRLLRNISELPYEGMPENERVTVSIGVAMLDRDTMPDADALIGAADAALYKAKSSGKNKVVMKGFEEE